MFQKSTAVALTFVAAAAAQATAPQWGQCGGQGWTGATTCPSGWACVETNQYYSQCLQGVASSAPSAPPPASTNPTPTTSSPIGSSPPTSAPSGTQTAGPTGWTLLPNNLWLRADEQPVFHHYLQSEVSGQPGPAVLGSYLTAAQYQLNDGQFEQQLPGGQVLYLNVNTTNPSNLTYLSTFFSTTPATVGTWAWQGDGLTWTAPGIQRQDIGAFLACPSTDAAPGAFVNLGAFDYMTPTGCADETLNYYNGATPTP